MRMHFGVAGLCVITLLLMHHISPAQAMTVDKSNDIFLAGYITSILERDLHWESGSYRLKVEGGVVTITLLKEIQRDRSWEKITRPQ